MSDGEGGGVVARDDLGEARRHTTYGAARATVFLAVLAAACLYFRRPLGACAGRVRRLPAMLAGLKGRLEAPTEELQSLNPNAAGLELQSPEPNGAPARPGPGASPAERRASARLARSMRAAAKPKAAAVSPAAAPTAHATPDQADQAGQEANGASDGWGDDNGWGDDSNGWGDDTENGWDDDNDWGETTPSPKVAPTAGRV